MLPQYKDALVDILSPYCKSPDDIFGKEDLNNLLQLYPKIERSTYKLWLCSENILQRILKSEIFQRSVSDIEDIKRYFATFVTTPAVPRAKKIIEENGCCLLSGIPEVPQGW